MLLSQSFRIVKGSLSPCVPIAKSLPQRTPNKPPKKLRTKFVPWIKEEDDTLMEALGLFGYGRWKAISDRVGTRTVDQCKRRIRRLAELKQNEDVFECLSERCHGTAAPKDRVEAEVEIHSEGCSPRSVKKQKRRHSVEEQAEIFNLHELWGDYMPDDELPECDLLTVLKDIEDDLPALNDIHTLTSSKRRLFDCGTGEVQTPCEQEAAREVFRGFEPVKTSHTFRATMVGQVSFKRGCRSARVNMNGTSDNPKLKALCSMVNSLLRD